MNSPKASFVLSSAVLAATCLSAQNLIVNGDFENGLSGGGYNSYSNEIGTFANGVITNNSNWSISNTYATAAFVDLLTPDSGWGIRMGNYSAGTNQLIGTFTDNTTGGVVQISEATFTLDTAGSYQLQLTPGDDSMGNAWVDNISLTAVPELSSTTLIIGLSSLGLVLYNRRTKK